MQNQYTSSWLAIWIVFLTLCLKSLGGNVCGIEDFDVVLSQYFSGLNSLDILIQPPFESDSFQVSRCPSQPKLQKMLSNNFLSLVSAFLHSNPSMAYSSSITPNS